MVSIDIILGDVRVTNDEHCYIVSLSKIKGKGKDAGSQYWLPTSYHSSLEQVAAKLAHHAASGINVIDTALFDKINTLIAGEQHRISKKLNKAKK